MKTQHQHSTSLVHLLHSVISHRELIWNMTRRSIAGRYRGSLFGFLWSFINPLLMLAIYTFAFSVVFQAKWGLENESHLDFALILFASLTVFNLFGDLLREAPVIILGQSNFVKKVVFPLEILPVISLATAAVNSVISLGIFIMIYGAVHMTLHWTMIFLPVVIFPLALIGLGLSYFIASIGVFFRDLGHLMGHVVTILLFTSPVFFSIERIPEKFRIIMMLNPVAYILESARLVMVYGRLPEWEILAAYSVGGLVLLLAGYWWFQKTRKGFADVI